MVCISFFELMQVPARAIHDAFQTVLLILVMTEVATEHSTSQLHLIRKTGFVRVRMRVNMLLGGAVFCG